MISARSLLPALAGAVLFCAPAFAASGPIVVAQAAAPAAAMGAPHAGKPKAARKTPVAHKAHIAHKPHIPHKPHVPHKPHAGKTK